jgi:hypothetical protein
MLNQNYGEANGEAKFALILLKNLTSSLAARFGEARRGGSKGVDSIEEFYASSRGSLREKERTFESPFSLFLTAEPGVPRSGRLIPPRGEGELVRPHTGERLRPVVGPALARWPARWGLQGAHPVDDLGDLVGGEAVEDGFEANLFAGLFDPLVLLVDLFWRETTFGAAMDECIHGQ